MVFTTKTFEPAGFFTGACGYVVALPTRGHASAAAPKRSMIALAMMDGMAGLLVVPARYFERV
jgi:hypothetical protein